MKETSPKNPTTTEDADAVTSPADAASVLPDVPDACGTRKAEKTCASEEPRARIERDIITRYRKTLWTPFIKALADYQLICDGDRICVCISGGKDSFLLAKLFQELYRHGRRNFEVTFLSMDPGYPEYARKRIAHNAEVLGVPLTCVPTNIFEIVDRLDGKPCYPCARMRRGALYNAARELGCNKIALGHHLDDVVETILMSMLYGGQVKTMMPKLHSTNFEGMELIRPLYLVREADIIGWRDDNDLEFIHCACPLSEGVSSDEAGSASKRASVKALIARLSQDDPEIAKSIFHSVENVHLDAVVGWRAADQTHSFLERYDRGWGDFE